MGVHLLKNGGEQKQPAYSAKNPQKLVPALEDNGQVFTQSLAIIEYLDEAYPAQPLLPAAATERARVRAMAQLIRELFAAEFSNPYLGQGNDQAIVPRPAGRLAIATDSHVISPLFFAGGDIGSLAVHGTINDLAVGGATPLYLSAGFILEEGLPLADLARIVRSMAAAARKSSMRLLVQEPMNTLSMVTSQSFWPGCKSM